MTDQNSPLAEMAGIIGERPAKPGNVADEAAYAFELIGLEYDRNAIQVWREICDRKRLTFTPGLLYANEPANEVLRRIADAGRVIFMITPDKRVKIFIDLEIWDNQNESA